MTPTPTPTTTSPKTSTTAKTPTAPKTTTTTPAKVGRYLDTDTIEVLVDNPKKVGSASRARFDHYGTKGSTTTVGEFLKAGGHRIDLPWDAQRKFIKISRARTQP
jgi:hypothetical protein